MGVKTFYNSHKLRTETGPGQYDPQHDFTNIKFSMGSRDDMALKKKKGNPGPGSYSDKNLYSSI